jgi:hypothetical protein
MLIRSNAIMVFKNMKFSPVIEFQTVSVEANVNGIADAWNFLLMLL